MMYIIPHFCCSVDLMTNVFIAGNGGRMHSRLSGRQTLAQMCTPFDLYVIFLKLEKTCDPIAAMHPVASIRRLGIFVQKHLKYDYTGRLGNYMYYCKSSNRSRHT